MKNALIAFLLMFSIAGKSQIVDSAWLERNILSKFDNEARSFLPSYSFNDEKGNKVFLSNYAGKIVYIDVWSTTCRPCLAQFPYQEQLLRRLKVVGLDSSVVFVNINIENSQPEWKAALKKHHPEGINLHSSDTSLYHAWQIEAFPGHILLSSSGKILGKNIVGPDDAPIDWLLYGVAKGMPPKEAIWIQYTQNKLMEKHKSASAFTNEEYAKWFKKLLPALLEYNSWRAAQRRGSSR